MLRSTSLITGLLFSLIFLSPASVAQMGPPAGGGSTGGGYSPGGGGSGGGSTGNGSGSSLVGNSGMRDNSGGLNDGSCCSEKENKPDASGFTPPTFCPIQDCVGIIDHELSCDVTCYDCGGVSYDGPLSGLNPGSGSGCGSCGGGSPGSGGGSGSQSFVDFKAKRNWLPHNRVTQSSYGPGVFGTYDSKVHFFPDPTSGTTAVLFDADTGSVFNLVDGLDGDVLDGTFHDVRTKAFGSLVLKDASGATVTSMSQAVSAELKSWKGFTESFGIFDLSTDSTVNEYVARLESATTRNGRTLTVSYRDSLAAGSGGFTAQQLSDSPARRWQIHQITDWQGDAATFEYGTAQVSGRWAVSKITVANGDEVDYAYAAGNIASVTHPNNAVSTYTYGQDSAAQTATVVIDNAGGAAPGVMHLTNDYMTLDANGSAAVINQPQGVFRMGISSAGEIVSMIVPDANQAGVMDVYYGTGSGSRLVVGTSNRYFSDGWTPVLNPQGSSIGISNAGIPEDEYTEVSTATTAADILQATIPGETDETGREFTYNYDTDGFLTKKTFVADTTFEEYAYNSFKQLTRVRDRQGNVIAYEYDANGNLTKQKTGLKEVGGQDVAQPEYAERQWAYYPSGHANAGQLKTAFDAEWDGSSTDLHRTDYEYNARGLMTKKLESASVAGGDRPETLWTYDSDDRVATTTDASGHQNDDTYNDRDQLIEKMYDDASTEQTLYGAIGTPQEGLVVKTKDRRNVVTSYTYDAAGRTTQVVVGTARDADILDGNADDTPITDRNEQSITTYAYLDGTELPIEVVRDGSKTEYVYDYRQRVIETKVYPYANKIMSSKVVYVDNKKFSDEDYYGRKKYYGYRASDGQLIRYVTGAYPSFSLADQTAVFNLVRGTNLNPAYTIKDAITDENGRPETVIDERGTQYLTEYNAAGQVIRETKAVGTPVEAITEMDYDEDGNVVEIRSPRYFDSTDTNGYQKCKTVMTYDGQGRVLSRTEAPGTPEAATESYAYDSEGRQVTHTDARGKIWTTTYASCCGHSVSSKNPLGHGSVSNKDNGGFVTHTAGIGDVDSHTSLLDPIDAKTLRETTTRYDALGRSIAACTWLVPQGIIDSENPPVAGFDGISGDDGLTSQTLYDADLTDGIGLDIAAGVTVTNPLGGTFTVSLSAALTKMAEPISQGGANTTFNADATGSAVVSLNAENEVSFSISDAQGRSIISGIQHPHDPLPGNTQGDLLTWSCHVTQAGSLSSSSSTVLAEKTISALGHITTSHTNGLGHTLETIDQLGFASTVKYDAAGNAIETRDPNQTGYDLVYGALNHNTSRTDMVGSQTQSVYDKSGQQVLAIDAKGKATTSVFNARGNRITEIDRLGYATNWAYDESGNLLSLTDAEAQTTSYTYNDAGQRITEQYPDHIAGAVIGDAGYGIITFSYDALGRRTVKEDQQGDTTSYNFDMSGRMLTRVYVGHPTSPLAGQADTDTFTYDRNGRMLSGIKGRYNNTVTFSYDDRGQQIQETLTTHGQTYTVGYEKNELGQTTQLQYPDGSLVDRAYTPRGQLLSVDYAPAGAAAPSDVADFVYDAGGRETTRNLGNGLTTSRAYFADNQIKTIATPTVEDLTYTYDPNKNPTSETRSGVMAPYSWTTGPTGFDNEDRLTNWSRSNGDSQTWNLSPVRDWTSTAINGGTQTRTHGPTHELDALTGTQVAAGTATLQHDTKGNTITDERGCGLGWDFQNMLEKFTANGVSGLIDSTYAYDAIGRRVSKTITQTDGSVETTLFVQGGRQIFCKYLILANTMTSMGATVYGRYLDEPLASFDSGASGTNPFFHHRNRQYSIYCQSNASGNIVQFHSYDAFGGQSTVSEPGTAISQNTLGAASGFTGREHEVGSGLMQFRMRIYSPNQGRFLARDPMTYIDGSNLYAGYFAAHSVDPLGLAACDCCNAHLKRFLRFDKPSHGIDVDDGDGASNIFAITSTDGKRKCKVALTCTDEALTGSAFGGEGVGVASGGVLEEDHPQFGSKGDSFAHIKLACKSFKGNPPNGQGPSVGQSSMWHIVTHELVHARQICDGGVTQKPEESKCDHCIRIELPAIEAQCKGLFMFDKEGYKNCGRCQVKFNCETQCEFLKKFKCDRSKLNFPWLDKKTSGKVE